MRMSSMQCTGVASDKDSGCSTDESATAADL